MVILEYSLLCLLLNACKANTGKLIEEDNALGPEPLTVSLDTLRGYVLNPLTGDSIKPLINSSGDTNKTGVSVSLFSHNISKEIVRPKIIEDIQIIKTVIPGNIHPVPVSPPFTLVDTTHLTKVKLGQGDTSFVLRNAYGVVPTGVAIPVSGKRMPFSEPRPVRTAPMRFKDNATRNIQYLDVEQGLGYSFITAIYEDKKGNIWFGLDGIGLSKYDGINITTYTVKEGLSDNIISSILEDQKGNIWFGTKRGVNCFDGKNFIQYTEKEGLSNNWIYSILQDRNGDLLFSSAGGLTRFNGKNFIHYSRKEGVPGYNIFKSIIDRKGDLWMATDRGAAKFDGNVFTWFTSKDGTGGDYMPGLSEDRNGNIWFGTLNEGVSVFDGKKITRFTKEEGLPDNTIWSIMEEKNGNIWISTANGGLTKYDGKNFVHYGLDQGLSNSKARVIIQDRSGNIWLPTEGGGLNRINVTNFNYSVPTGVLENNRIRPILKDKKGNLWFGTESANVGKLDAEINGKKEKLFTYYKVQDKLPKGQRSLLQDRFGNIWIGTTGAGLIKFDGKTFTKYTLSTDPASQSFFDMHEDQKGTIWFGQVNGTINSYDGKKFSVHTTSQGLPGTIIYSIFEDRKGNIWFCTQGAGVYKYDGSNFINYTEKEGLFSKSVTSGTEDNKGNIWFGTLGSGVCKFDGINFTYYTSKQGLTHNDVWSVFQDPATQIWFGTTNGLTLFIPEKDSLKHLKSGYSIYNFGLQDGLKAADFNLHSVCMDNDNTIWWGTGKGVLSFDRTKEFHPDSVRSLSISYIEINERFYDFRNLPDSAAKQINCSDVIPFTNYPGKLSLSHDQNHMSFHFSAIDWSAPTKIKYSYRLVGLDNKWSSPSGEPVAGYRNLSHGNYEFQVKAIGQLQVWTAPFIYRFTIRPAWWQSWWFKILITVAFLTLVFFIARFIYYYQLRKQRVTLEKQLAVQYERQRISAEMHDDIGAGLSGIRLLTEMTKNKVKDEQAAEEVDKIYQSVGDISSKMKEVIWSLNTENDSLPNLISYIQKQARTWLENYPCQLHIELPESASPLVINGETRRDILLMIKEAIHNIIKHSGADKVSIKMSWNNRLFTIAVSDNGKGLPVVPGNEAGNGMKNMQQRVRKLGGKFFIKDQEGLTLTFEIPLQPNS